MTTPNTDMNSSILGNNQPSWQNIPQERKEAIIWLLWFITWVMLLAGLFSRFFYEVVVLFSIAHTILFLYFFNYQYKPFPVQLRIAYVFWVVVGTYVPGMTILMYITTVGLAANLFLGYCPMARMMCLLPWNREETLTWELVKRVLLTPPVKGKFTPSAQT